MNPISGAWRWIRVQRMSSPTNGTLIVHVCAQPDTAVTSSFYSALVLGKVTAPGLSPRNVQVSCTIPANRCPVSKQRVPVIVDIDQPSRLIIKWEQVPVRALPRW